LDNEVFITDARCKDEERRCIMINEQRFEWDLGGHEVRINCILM